MIFVAHSMGGLIIKEAYMQGQHDPEYEDIIKSICAITFLATPHRGTQLAQTLNRILQSSMVTNSKQYVAELASNSLTLQKLNEQFRHIAPRLDIISFYETQPTAIGLKNNRIMVLEKDSSVLGYPGELSRALDADHHGVCKYDGSSDPNYVTVRNVLKSLVSKIVARRSNLEPTSHRKASKDLKIMLAINDLPDTDYIFFRDQWTEGTCDWILDDKLFLCWADVDHPTSRVLWLTGGPATGKSVLASFVVNHLTQQGMQCQYFFIRFSTSRKRGLSHLLRSIAYQMTQTMPEFGRDLAELEDERINFESLDPRIIWDRLFKSILFMREEDQPIYWVIDGLDEADDPRVLIRTLLDMSSSLTPIRLLLVSRKTSEIQNSLMKASKTIESDEIKVESHTNDLFSYIQHELELSGDAGFKQSIEQRLLQGSQNNFLVRHLYLSWPRKLLMKYKKWVRLAVDRINRCHRQADIEEALKELPDGMAALYDRMVTAIFDLDSDHDKNLAVAILRCLACSVKPLKVFEVAEAATEDKSEMLNFERSIVELCGGFVIIDNDGNACLIHQTAREYLFSGRTSGLTQVLKLDEAHAHMFQCCMQCLVTTGLRIKFKRGEGPGLLEYAAKNWFYHLISSPMDDDEVLNTLERFLSGQSVLTWIHIVAASNHLQTLIQASRHLSKYSRQRRDRSTSKDTTDVGILQVESADSWAKDLVKIVGKFGPILRRDAEAIYKMVPPFCPRNSAIYQQFGKPESKLLQVSRQSTDTWDDLTARISFGAYMSRISASSAHLAVLNSKGNVFLYDSRDFRESSCGPIQHHERVYMMELNGSATLLATYGYRTVKIWEVPSGLCKFSVSNVESKPRPLAMRFSRNNKTLLVGTDDKKIRSLNLVNPEPSWELTAELEELEMDGHFLNAANYMALNDEGSLIAVAYRGHPLSAWEVEGPTHVGHCWRKRDELARGEVIEAIWHPFDTEVIGLYIEGVVFRWNPYDEEVFEVPTGASKLALSRDGSLFSTGDVHGKIKVYTTVGFSLLYQLASQDTVFDIAFTPDSRRLYDIRGYYGNAWEPNVLAEFMERPGKDSDNLSETESLAQSSSLALQTAPRVDAITALTASPSGNLYIYGTDKGSVTLSSVRKGTLGEIHATKAFFSIERMAWSDDGKLLAFSDSSKKIFVYSVVANSDSLVERRAEISVTSSTTGPIFQFAFSTDSDSLFVQTSNSIHTICIDSSSLTQSHQLNESEVTWIRHPQNTHQRLGFGSETVYLLDFNSSKIQYFSYDLEPHADRLTERTVDTVLPTNDGMQVLVQFSVRNTTSSRKLIGSFAITSLSTMAPDPEDAVEKSDVKMTTIMPNILPESISSEVMWILGFISQSRLVFLSRDYSICTWQYQHTSRAWCSSMAVKKSPPVALAGKAASRPFKEIFHLPSDWVTKDCVALFTAWKKERSILLPRNGEVRVVRCTALA